MTIDEKNDRKLYFCLNGPGVENFGYELKKVSEFIHPESERPTAHPFETLLATLPGILLL